MQGSRTISSTAPYTIVAPQDAAFDAMGGTGTELRKPEQRAAKVAILSDHLVAS